MLKNGNLEDGCSHWGLASVLGETSLVEDSQKAWPGSQVSLPPQPCDLGLDGNLVWSVLVLSQGSLFLRSGKSLIIRCVMFCPFCIDMT